jgi:hypothetical protein
LAKKTKKKENGHVENQAWLALPAAHLQEGDSKNISK